MGTSRVNTFPYTVCSIGSGKDMTGTSGWAPSLSTAYIPLTDTHADETPVHVKKYRYIPKTDFKLQEAIYNTEFNQIMVEFSSQQP